MSFGFHYFLCKWWAYSTVFLLAPLFSILICLISLLSEYIKCMSYFHLHPHVCFSPRSIFKYAKCLPSGLASLFNFISYDSYYLLPSALRDLLSVLPPPPSLCVLLQWFNFFTVLITSWACFICLLFIFCLSPQDTQDFISMIVK